MNLLEGTECARGPTTKSGQVKGGSYSTGVQRKVKEMVLY